VTVVVAIDAGTTGVRAIAFNHLGLPLSSSYREFTQFFPQPGWVEHDANEIWTAIQLVLSELKTALDAAGETIAAIGITDQRETIVAWDRSTGQPCHRAIVWQDRRTADYCAQLESDGALDLVRSTTGLVLDPYFSGTKAHWLFTEGGVTPDDSVAIGTIDSWLIWKLTGGDTHVTDATNASRTMLFDIRSGEWSDELCELLGVPRHVLPQVVPSSGRVAVTAPSCALGSGIPISGIAGDQQASLFGQACFVPGMAKNTYGTGSFVLMNMGTECPTPVEGLLTTIAWSLLTESGTPQLTYAYEGAIFVTGSGVQWLRDGLQLIDNSNEITALASSVDSTDGVVVVPAFTGLGSPWWDPYARGPILGITRGTTAAHIARAMLEAIALQTRDVVDAMTNAGGLALQSLRADGGAASDFVLQLQADQLGVPVHRPTVSETTALGAAYLAGLAEGFWDSLDDIAENWAIDITIEPASDRSMVEPGHQQWLRAVERSRGWAKESPGD
jgi:glycerol kinase